MSEVHAGRQRPKAQDVSQSWSRSVGDAIGRFRMKALTFKTKGRLLRGCPIAGRTRGALLALRCGVSIGTDISRERLGNAFLTATLPSCGLHQPRTKVGTPRELEASNFARPDVHGDNEE